MPAIGQLGPDNGWQESADTGHRARLRGEGSGAWTRFA